MRGFSTLSLLFFSLLFLPFLFGSFCGSGGGKGGGGLRLMPLVLEKVLCQTTGRDPPSRGSY